MTMLIDASFHRAIETIMARAADRAILPRFGKLLAGDRHEKALDELVTIADRESEQILAEGLHQLMPNASIVGEEAADADPSILDAIGGELCWIIDPLDGTANFAEGQGPFGILVALASEGAPIGGWIFDPRTRRFCAASRGSGAFINGERVKARRSSNDVPVAAISTLLSRQADKRELVDRIGQSFAAVPIPRCAAELYPSLVLGERDLAFFGRTLPWDHATGVLFLTEAGGQVSRFDGSAYDVADGRFGLVAAVDNELWQRAMEAVLCDEAAAPMANG